MNILYIKYIIKLKFICWLFIHFTNLINAWNKEHIKTEKVLMCATKMHCLLLITYM